MTVARVTLSDVAADAGVSKATASLVLNDSPLIAEATKLADERGGFGGQISYVLLHELQTLSIYCIEFVLRLTGLVIDELLG